MDEKKNHINEPNQPEQTEPANQPQTLSEEGAGQAGKVAGSQSDMPTADAEQAEHSDAGTPRQPADESQAPAEDEQAEQSDETAAAQPAAPEPGEEAQPAQAGEPEAETGAAQAQPDEPQAEPAAESPTESQAAQTQPQDGEAPKKKKKRLSLGSKIIIGVGAAIVLVAALFMPMLYRVFYDQQSSFASKPATTPVATDDPYYELLTQADTSMMKDIVNVLLIGVDYAEERETWSGKHQFNSDVMIVLALNFKENKVDMISIPRDTYAKLPNLDGFYKMNSALHYGGGIPDGFTNVMQACSWELGGIPIDYYMAVTMPTVKELVDEIGGVDYDVDVEIHMQGRTIKMGFQHMDGQMCLDYFRARKGIDNDLGRINRQKKLLVAIFNKLRDEKGILDLPDLVKKFEGKLYTNMTLEQVAAAAVFGYKLPTESITMRSLPGSLMNIYNWNFVIVNQPKRVEMIKEVYGVTVKQMDEYGQPYCKWQWATMQGEAYIERVQEKLNGAAAGKLAEDQSAHFAELIATLQSAMNAQKNVANSKKQSDAINAAKDELRSYAEQVLGPLGITINWKVAENPDGPPVLQ